jgi:hypothetical protein
MSGRDVARVLVQVAVVWAFMAAAAQGRAQEIVEVRADGVAAIRDDVGLARDQALRDALRRAVEEAVGVVVEGRTLMVDLAVVEDRVRGRSEGFVRSYDVVNEERDGDLYRLTVLARVSRELVEEDLEGFGAILRSALGNPRIVVLPEADVPVRVVDDITTYFVARSFFVLDPRQALVDRASDLRASPATLAELARSLEAELVVDVNQTSTSSVVRETDANTFYRGEATVSLRGVLATTAQVVAAASEGAVFVATSEQAALDGAILEATRATLSQFALAVVAALNTSARDEGTLVSIRLSVAGLPGFSAYQDVASFLRSVRGVADVQARRFEAGAGTYDVQGTASAMDVAFALAEQASLPLEVVSFDDRSVALQWR